jgi:formylglycine-generating enzyme required for sulfatase activity
VTPLPATPTPGSGKVPSGFRAAASTVVEPYTNTGWAKEIVHEKTGIEMVYVPAGSFAMGSPASEAGQGEQRQRQVTLTKAFYLGRYEVTQEQWERVMGNNPSEFKQVGKTAPVEKVSWTDCQEYVGKLNTLDPRPSPPGTFRLPTEAEWEYACRAGTTGAYAGILDEMGWYDKNSGKTTHPVGQKKPNAWGLWDMHGNVWEWCADWAGNYPAGPATDPAGPETGECRVMRGGSWNFDASICRAARGWGDYPGSRNSVYGLRLARTVSP